MLLVAAFVFGCSAPSGNAEPVRETDCQWCGSHEAPAKLASEARLAPSGEEGEPLVVTGTVYRADGKTPASGILLYAYHANLRGDYPKRGDEAGQARRHGYLRGWMRTGANGEYRIVTIRPGMYERGGPAHIHMTVKEPDRDEYYIDETVFEGDPRLTDEHRRRLQNRGGSGIVKLQRGTDGVWRGVRNIVLMR